MRQALWIAVVAGFVVTIALNNAEPVYHFVGVDPLAIPLAADYLAAISTGLVPLLAILRCVTSARAFPGRYRRW